MPRAIVIGGGIGGLAAGIALRQNRFHVNLLERSDALREKGAALLMASNAMHALDALGVADEVRAAGVAPAWAEVRAADGRLLKRIANAEVERRLGAPNVAIMRPLLHRALADRLGDDAIHLRARADAVGQDDDRAWVRTRDGRVWYADVVVGADGIGSVVRKSLHGASPARRAGFLAWRGVAPHSAHLLPPDTGIVYLGRGGEAGIAPAGGGAAYWYATVPAGSAPEIAPLRERLRDAVAAYEPLLRALIDATPDDAIRCDDIRDRDPIRGWGRGRITLLGDAAHPMTPNAGQGAAQALEDAVVLGRALGGASDVVRALRDYEARREKRTAAIVELSRRNARMALLTNRVAVALRDLMVRATPGQVLVRRLASAARFET